MCLNKLYIRNNKLDFNPSLDRFFNYVPCGSCSECIAQQQQGYVLRMINEYENTKGSTFYYTLTYDNENLPKFDDVSCFSKRHITTFLKRLRKNIPVKLKYFISSEYGAKTKRPHYHAIFYLDDTILSADFKRKVQKAWYYGIAYTGLNNGLVVDVRPFSYVAKYCVKDSDCFDYLDLVLDDDIIQDYVCNENDLSLFPFHVQSNGLGKNLCESISDFDLIRGYIVKNDINSLTQKYSLPLYVYRKCLYDTYKNKNGNISYVLNSRGLKLIKSRLLYRANKLFEQIDSVYNDIYNSVITDDDIENYDLQNLKQFLPSPSDLRLKSNFIKDYVHWECLYCNNNQVPFKFSSFNDDLDIYVDFLKNPVDYGFQWVESPYELTFFTYQNYLQDFQSCLKYEIYKRTLDNYNTLQYFRSQKSGFKLPKKICDLKEFINFKTSHSCLTTFQECRKCL